MRFPGSALSTVALLACLQDDTLPPLTSPDPSVPLPNSLTTLWGMVIAPGGACIPGGGVTVVRGPTTGQRVIQETPCDAWGYDGGFVLQDVRVGVEMTVLVEAPGFPEAEMTVVPAGPQRVVLFTLTRPPDSDPPSQPPSPSPPGTTGFLYVLVVDESGVCVVGARITVVGGQLQGRSIEQETPCSVWGYSGGVWFSGLTPGVGLTLLATAPGYADTTVTAYPSVGSGEAFIISPSPN